MGGPVAANIAEGASSVSPMTSGPMAAIGELTRILSGRSADPVNQFKTSEGFLPKPQTMSGKIGGMAAEFLAPLGAERLGAKTGFLSKYPKAKMTDVEKAQSLRGDMFAKRSALGKELDQNITALSKENPDKRVDLSGVFEELKMNVNDPNNPGLASEVRSIIRKIKDPELAGRINRYIENPRYAEGLNLRTSEDIKRALSQAPSISSKAGNKFANWTPGDLEVLDLVDNVKLAQAESFGDELSKLRAPYAEYMKNYKFVKNSFKEGRLLGKAKTKFGDAELEAAAKKILSDDAWKEIEKLRGAEKIKKIAKAVGITTGLGAVGGAAGKTAFDTFGG